MAIRGPSSSSKPVANRRAYRPDRHVYRQLRRGGRKRWGWIEWAEVAIALLVIAGLIWLVRWLFF